MLRVVLLLTCLATAAGAAHLGKTLDGWRGDLNSSNRQERLIAARSVGEMAVAGERGADQALFEAIEHEDSAVRYWAVVAAGLMGDRAAAATGRLEKALEDEAPEVRVWAAFALAKLGRADEMAQRIGKELAQNPERGARLQAVHALDELGDAGRSAIPQLRAALDDSFDYVKRVARHALWVLGDRPCPYQTCE